MRFGGMQTETKEEKGKEKGMDRRKLEKECRRQI